MLTKLLISAILFQVALSNDDIEGRVVGGVSTTIDSTPYQVGVFFGNYLCGGSIITNKVILTAAHCTAHPQTDRDNAFVRAGSAIWYEGGQTSDINRIFDHESYNGVLGGNDLSILELKTSLEFDTSVKPINIATYVRDTGVIATVSGWGRTIPNDPNSLGETLQSAALNYFNTNDCRRSNHGTKIINGMVCAGATAGLSACQGDSGGPLVHNGELIGVVSWGEKECAKEGSPGVFVDVYYYRSWIFNVLRTINGY